ncbi:potassium channel family protein [Mesorhizobium sp. BR115XR7A]|uniref:potassium channel family protein n=1 Tax=Mesorhizobium sp. BR115XR7A TaxID=2876645 RepID=UPI001CC9CFBB|nr:potassium channel family protein [Mesorhizobium sp. BR115XR7A]MBZ9905465.1 potassium channel family protein [Mesorhizobium sp. BR115XR7A]MBZ9929585.1 potassium channel family protein [Mesorhizobium sp. BR1-1-5]
MKMADDKRKRDSRIGTASRSKKTTRCDLIVIFGALAAHTVEITFYGFVFWGLHSYRVFGEIVGEISNGWVDFLYFSVTNYTTLGVGDIRAEGPIRLIASSEALTGLVLLSWTASFTYLSMENFWKRR